MNVANKTSFGKQCTRSRTCTPIQCHMSFRSAYRLSVPSRPVFAPEVLSVETQRAFKPCRATAEPAVATSSNQEKTTNPLNLVFVATEVAPWSKTGGLGDVVGGLPIELAKRGHNVLTIAPRYDQYADGWDTSVVINVDGEDVRFFHAVKKGVHRVFVDHPWFLAKVWGKTGSKLYGPKSGADFVDNHRRFALFNKAAIEATRALPFGFGENCVFIANDWHSALVPVLLKDLYQPRGEFTKAKVAFCIHNIAFQGRMWPETFKEMGLPTSSLSKFAFQDGVPKVYTEEDPMEEDEAPLPKGGMFDKINWMKAGILSADKLITVSPNYATEIMSGADKGVEMHSYLAQKGVEGIVNGMDVEEWDPASDKLLTIKYDKTNVFVGKAAAKEQLQAEAGLPVDGDAPVFAFIGRLEEQKGVDILLAALPKAVAANKKAQIIILGTGKAVLEKQVAALEKSFKGQVKGVVKFSAPLAHLMTAGADFILVPSRFEPCGLIQLHAMQYGTVPLVASTGGLVDTVKEGVTGFHIGALDPEKLVPEDADAVAATITRASQVFSTPLFKEMVNNCISQDLSWAKPARKWEGVIEEMISGVVSVKKETVKVPVANPIPGDKPPSPILAAAPKVSESAAKPPVRTLGLVTSTSSPVSGSESSNGNGSAAPAKGRVGAAGKVPSTPSVSAAASPSNKTSPVVAAPASTTSNGNGAAAAAAPGASKPLISSRT
ncbi:hypothetical protein CEUSTIGMA_g6031.t1 [Chlamydomonas eustigma]|uniref:Starch synthase, chloroplastic/amyloplastic n=1 Tax=Chlamydomonas eustigma TaxID=1157962 RepID=A0A250X6S9_9CHLO|nr:hypothetical protein CEUSTIGMA_g6031.t1 [Chlamydomonas eustigma]|eukprot:GAX78592.1 hypothetical protein CEUSTIGMA_g6031.t1 [Chlamydomonas eustigma]